MGTVPHALIASYDGDTVAAARAFADRFSGEMNIVVLVDFDNDSVRTSLEVAEALGDRLWGVRLDTAHTLVDRSLTDVMGRFDPRGVNPELVRLVRQALDEAGHRQVRIVVSGGFNAERIREFERQGRAGRRLRGRLEPDPGRERLHGGRRDGGGQAVRKGGPEVPPQRAHGAGGLV